jgi:acetylornithine/N-succinyldiaminopimelate aminotransferase
MARRIIYSTSSPWRFYLKKASGSYLWTSNNKKLIDFTSGWNVTNLGWNNPEITEAIIKQSKINHYCPMWASEDIQEKLAKDIIASLPSGLEIIARATSGTEANEEALKIARAYTGRGRIVGFKNTYHGQSFGTMSIGYEPREIGALSPMMAGFTQMNFPETTDTNNVKIDAGKVLLKFSNDLERELIGNDVAAVICEAGIVTGWGDTRIASNGFITLVRKLTKKYGSLLILDEVGTGFSRSGKFLAMNIENIIPDILTLAKGLSNGASAIGCMITSKNIAEIAAPKSNITSTFGWTPISCAAALKTLQIHKRDKVWEKANNDGSYMLSILQKELLSLPTIRSVKGLGMIVGITFNQDKLANMVVETAFERGLHIVCDNDKNIQIMPPLTIDRKDLDYGLAILIKTVKTISIV